MFHTELFVRKLSASIVFYRCLFGKPCAEYNEKRALFKNEDGAALLLTDESVLGENHYFTAMADSKKGKGVELILPVNNLEAVFNKIHRIYPENIESAIVSRPWGKVDFRVVDPDGYYVRVTS
ncbi:VOC family protein [Terribacillus saccharophilus]|uniref:VOC family protein n=1 Tax=Terribacillus saccharophilus TaxID=361277 RepID=UPI003981C9C7